MGRGLDALRMLVLCGRHCLCLHPRGLGCAQWAFPGLRIVRRRPRRASQQAVACARDVFRLGQVMERSLPVRDSDSVEAFSLRQFESLLLGNSLREALSGTTWNRVTIADGLDSGVSLGGVISCTVTIPCCGFQVSFKNKCRLFECGAWAWLLL